MEAKYGQGGFQKMVIVVIGVEASGKTTIGKLLAERWHSEFADADDFHSAANKEKMHQGIPLTDADRWPWLAAIRQRILEWIAAESRRDRCDYLPL